MQIAQITPVEHAYVARTLALAHADAQTALTTLQRPQHPAMVAPVGTALEACYEAAEHLHDVLQVDVPGDLVADIRHAIEQLEVTIDTLVLHNRPGMHPPAAPVAGLAAAVTFLGALEQRVRHGVA